MLSTVLYRINKVIDNDQELDFIHWHKFQFNSRTFEYHKGKYFEMVATLGPGDSFGELALGKMIDS